jgi:hypothetical protein
MSYWENTEYNKGRTGRGKTFKRKQQECVTGHRLETAKLTLSPPKIR